MSISPDSADDRTPTPGGGTSPGATPSAVIRIPPTAYVAIVALGVIMLLPAVAWPQVWGWLPVIPIAIAYWVARRRTIVSADGVEVRGLLGTRTVPWDSVRGIVVPTPRIFGRSWARLVLADETRLALPAVTWRQLPAVAFASGGRLTMPTAPADSADTATE